MKMCQKQCPLCGNEIDKYKDTEIDGPTIYFEFECKKCGAYGEEKFDLLYVGSWTENE